MTSAVPAPTPDGFLDAATVRGTFDRAVEHWNARRFFEAHEDWETLWNDAEGGKREWLQGLIQFAAAFVHYERGGAAGFARLVRTAAEKAGGCEGEAFGFGIDFDRLWRELTPWVAHGRLVEHGAALSDGAPPSPPRIRHLPGVEPAPLPWAPEAGDAGEAADGGD